MQPFDLKTPVVMDTGNGPHACTKHVCPHDIVFLELSLTGKCKQMKCAVDEQKLSHTLTIGRIFLRQIGSDISFKNAKVTQCGEEMPSRPWNCCNNKQVTQKVLTDEPHSTVEARANLVCDDAATECKETDLHKLSTEQVHSTSGQRQQLLEVLDKHSRLFEGFNHEQLGVFPNCKCHVNLNLGAKACRIKQPCSISLNQVKASKTEMRRQVNLGVVEQCCVTEWGMPVFIVPKTGRSCRLVADFASQTKWQNLAIIHCQSFKTSSTGVKTFFTSPFWMHQCSSTPSHLTRNHRENASLSLPLANANVFGCP